MFLFTIIKVIILLGVLVFIHELGHFLVAKRCNVKVTEFSIGFGPKIFCKKWKETLYSLRLIPLGGFVNMLGEEQHIEDPRAYNKAKIWKRFLILLAGGMVNIVFGIVIYFILVSTSSNYISNIIEKVDNNSVALQYGIQSGDKILKINNIKIRLKSDIDKILEKSEGKSIILLIKRDNNLINIELAPIAQENKTIGIYLGAEGQNLSSEIKTVYENTPAFKAGLKQGDNIIAIDDIQVRGEAYAAVNLINSGKESVKVTVERNKEQLDFFIKPDVNIKYYMGVFFKTAEKNLKNNIYYGFWDTVDFTTSILKNLKELFSGDINVNQLTGPIGISSMVAQTQGFIDFIYLLGLISLSLGITNLLPFPPLDGGKIILLLIEKIRKKPLTQTLEMTIQTAGFLLIIILSFYVTYNDILRVF